MEEDFVTLDLMKYFRLALHNWKKIILGGFIAGVVGIVLSFGLPKEYVVVSKVAPELSLRTNSLTSLASMAGLNMNMLSNNNDALLPTVYPEIVKSVPFITDLFDMPVNDGTLYEYILNDQKLSWLGTVISLPGRLIGMAVDAIKVEDDSQNDSLDVFKLTKEQNRVYKALRKNIMVEVDKKTFLVTITVKMQDAYVAATLSKTIVDNLKDYVTEYRTGKAKDNVSYLQTAFDRAKDEYYMAQKSYALYCDAHQEMLSQRALVEKQRLQNETNLKYQIYSSVAQQLQQAEVNVQLEAPVFAEVVPPTVPVRKSKPSRSKFAIFFALMGVMGVIVYLSKKNDL